MSDNWLVDTIAKETTYDEGYDAGKQATAQQILDELENLVDTSYKAAKKKQAEFDSSSDTNVYWTGRLVSYGEVLKAITELKKKYQVY